FSLRFPNPNPSSPSGTFTIRAKASNADGSTLGNPITFTIDTVGPTQVPNLNIDPNDDSGIVGDAITNVRRPHFFGTVTSANPQAIIRLYRADASGNPTGPVLSQTNADSNGNYSFTLPQALSDGRIPLVVTAADNADNLAQSPSTALPVTIVTVSSDY